MADEINHPNHRQSGADKTGLSSHAKKKKSSENLDEVQPESIGYKTES